MIILGAYVFTALEQRDLVDGAVLQLPRERIQPRILRRGRIGDLLWVKEPWVLLTPRRGAPTFTREAVPGNLMKDFAYPAHVRQWRGNLRLQVRPALELERFDSRATLEITGIDDQAVHVRVHMANVDVFTKARVA